MAEAIPYIIYALGGTKELVVFATILVSVYGQEAARSKAIRRAAAQAAEYNAGLVDRNIAMQGGEMPWQVIYGSPTVAPAYTALLTSGARDEFKHLVCVWAAHRCHAITDVLLGGVSVGALDVDGNVTAGRWFKSSTLSHTFDGTFSGGAVTLPHVPTRLISTFYEWGPITDRQRMDLDLAQVTQSGATLSTTVTEWQNAPVSVTYEYEHRQPLVRVRHHLGAEDQLADASLVAELPGEWSSTDRGRGLCYSIITFDLNEPEFQGGPPQITAKVQGAALYDPRKDSTNGGSGAHRANDPATWEYSSNNALCVADFLRAEYGKRASAAQVVWSTVAAAANGCDEAVSDGTTTQARYTCHGSFRTDRDPDQTLTDLLQNMAGLATFGGVWQVQAGVYSAPVMDLTDADNNGPVEVLPGPEFNEVMNGARGVFYDPQRYNQQTDFPPYQNAAFLAEDGQPYWGPLGLPFCDTAWRAHNLARIAVERSRTMRLVYPAKMRALRLRPGQRVTLTNPLLNLAGAPFRVIKRQFAPGGPVQLWLEQDSPTFYDTVDAPATVLPPAVEHSNPFVVAPVAGLVAHTGTGYVTFDDAGTVISRVVLAYTAATDVLVRSNGALHIEYRLDTTGGAVWTRVPDAPADGTSQPLMGLLAGRRYLVRARWFNGLASSDWTVVTVAPLGDSTVSGAGDTAAQVTIYQRAASAPTLPSTVATYTFATGAITGLNNGWQGTVPSGSEPLYVGQAQAFGSGATVDIGAAAWTGPRLLVQNGAATIVPKLDRYGLLLPAYADGPVSSYADAVVTMSIEKDNVDDTANWTFTNSIGGGVTAVSTSGTPAGRTVTITAFSSSATSGYVDLSAAQAGYATQTIRVPVNTVRSATAQGMTPGLSVLSDDLRVGSSGTARAGIKFKSNGQIEATRQNGTNTIDGNSYTPTTTGIGSTYSVKAVQVSGAAMTAGAALNIWHAISSEPEFALGNGVPDSIAYGAATFYIAKTSDLATVLSTGQIALEAERA